MSKSEDTGRSVLIVSASEQFTAAVKKMVKGVIMLDSKKSAATARRMILERYYDLVIINAPLPDEPGEDLAIDVTRECRASVLLVTPGEMYNDVLEHVFSVEDDWENYVPIPNVYDGNEREIMAGFAEKLEAPQREELLGALKGSGAVGRFHRQIRRLRLAEEWENFQEEWFHALAQEWCEENALAYE